MHNNIMLKYIKRIDKIKLTWLSIAEIGNNTMFALSANGHKTSILHWSDNMYNTYKYSHDASANRLFYGKV
jgi:hypothetical protein